MTSSDGNIFRVTGPLCGEFTGHRWIPCTKASDAEFWRFCFIGVWINGWVNNREAGDLRCHALIMTSLYWSWGRLLWIYVIHLLINFRAVSPALGQSCHCPGVREVILNNMGIVKWSLTQPKHSKHYACTEIAAPQYTLDIVQSICSTTFTNDTP